MTRNAVEWVTIAVERIDVAADNCDRCPNWPATYSMKAEASRLTEQWKLCDQCFHDLVSCSSAMVHQGSA